MICSAGAVSFAVSLISLMVGRASTSLGNAKSLPPEVSRLVCEFIVAQTGQSFTDYCSLHKEHLGEPKSALHKRVRGRLNYLKRQSRRKPAEFQTYYKNLQDDFATRASSSCQNSAGNQTTSLAGTNKTVKKMASSAASNARVDPIDEDCGTLNFNDSERNKRLIALRTNNVPLNKEKVDIITLVRFVHDPRDLKHTTCDVDEDRNGVTITSPNHPNGFSYGATKPYNVVGHTNNEKFSVAFFHGQQELSRKELFDHDDGDEITRAMLSELKIVFGRQKQLITVSNQPQMIRSHYSFGTESQNGEVNEIKVRLSGLSVKHDGRTLRCGKVFETHYGSEDQNSARCSFAFWHLIVDKPRREFNAAMQDSDEEDNWDTSPPDPPMARSHTNHNPFTRSDQRNSDPYQRNSDPPTYETISGSVNGPAQVPSTAHSMVVSTHATPHPDIPMSATSTHHLATDDNDSGFSERMDGAIHGLGIAPVLFDIAHSTNDDREGNLSSFSLAGFHYGNDSVKDALDSSDKMLEGDY